MSIGVVGYVKFLCFLVLHVDYSHWHKFSWQIFWLRCNSACWFHVSWCVWNDVFHLWM